jgi:drug/metabolite transporter (DMT)-like permease
MISERLRPLLFVLLHGFLVAANVVIARALLVEFPPLLFRLLQFAIASLVYLALPLLRRDLHLSGRPGLWLRAGIYGLMGTVLPLSAMILGLQYLSSGVMSLFLTINPIVIFLLASRFLPDEPMTIRKLLGALLAFSGIGLVLLRGENGLSEVVRSDPRGYIWAVLLVLTISGSVVFARRFLQHEPSFDVASVRIFSATILMAPIVLMDGNFDLSRVTFLGVGGLIFTTLLGLVGALWLELIIIQRFGASTASQVSYVIPVFALLLGAAFLGEQITLTILAGFALVVIGLRLLNSGSAGVAPT